jgi:nicotinate-nucleotide adenylyltransferase
MQFLRPASASLRRIALFAGAFHPPTIAHCALAAAAKEVVDETIWVLPRSFPHKNFDAVDLEQRSKILLAATNSPVAIADSNYFFAMAAELAAAIPGAAVHLLIGEDGVDRLLNWDYGLSPEATRAMLLSELASFPVLSARRQTQAAIADDFLRYIRWLEMPPAASTLSSTEVRARIESGEEWASLVPPGIRDLVSSLYRR